MDRKFKDFLYNFTTDDHWVLDFEVEPKHAILINDLLCLYSVDDLQSYAEQVGDRWFVGMHFLFQCVEYVDDTNRLPFLEFVWEMFRNGTSNENTDGFHAWVGSFDPIEGEELNSRLATWFREGVIRFELDQDDIDGSLNWSVSPYWWKSLDHFLAELCAYQTTGCFLKALEYFANVIFEQRLKKSKSKLSNTGQVSCKRSEQEKFLLNHDLSKLEVLKAFKSWAADELYSYDFHI